MIKNLEEIVVEIKQNANKKYHEGASNYFKEGIILYTKRHSSNTRCRVP